MEYAPKLLTNPKSVQYPWKSQITLYLSIICRIYLTIVYQIYLSIIHRIHLSVIYPIYLSILTYKGSYL